jgi:hypothetical protein
VLTVCCSLQRDVIDESILKFQLTVLRVAKCGAGNVLLVGALSWGKDLLTPQLGCSEFFPGEVWFDSDVSGQRVGPIFEEYGFIRC